MRKLRFNTTLEAEAEYDAVAKQTSPDRLPDYTSRTYVTLKAIWIFLALVVNSLATWASTPSADIYLIIYVAVAAFY